STLRFRGRKSLARRRAHSLIDEPLEAPAVEVFADVDVAFAVDREGMRHVQRSAEDTLLSDVVDDLERLTQKNPHVVVRAVDRVVRAKVFVVRLVAVRAPHALESQRLGVDYDDAAVPVAVTDIQLIVYGIHREVRGATKVLRVGTAAALALMAELRQELTLRRELEDLGVLVAASRQPDVVFRVDKDAVLGRRPLVALAGATP